jgi:uncharacterized protein (TIGR02757 family)
VNSNALKDRLDSLYTRCNHRRYAQPDPLQFLYDYEDRRDREIVGLVASSLAYGRVSQILASVSLVLARMRSPAVFLHGAGKRELVDTFEDFRHRFTSGADLADLLYGARCAIEDYGSLEACFRAGLADGDETVVPALSRFTREIWRPLQEGCHYLLPDPARGSACKRAFLFLRWMIRKDAVDPGGWQDIAASRLVVPLDTHMYRISRDLDFTRRRQANLKTALEITARFREIEPDDPVKYDFTLTRFGIRAEMDRAELIDYLELGPVPC